jgi:hypothetical protein
MPEGGGCGSCYSWSAQPRGGFRPLGLPGFRGHFTEPAVDEPNLLLDANFNGYGEQPWPTTVAAMNALGLPDPTSIWLFDEAAGDFLDRLPAGNDLTPASMPYQTRCVGFWNGSDMISKLGTQIINSSAIAQVANANIFDIGANDSIAVLLVFRYHVYRSISAGLFQKRVNAPNLQGYLVFLTATGGLQAYIGDNVANVNYILASNFRDHAWHCLLYVIDRNTNTSGLWTDIGNNTGNAIGAIGSPSNADSFHFGQCLPGIAARPCVQFAYAAVFEGAQAEGMGAADLANFWVYGQDWTGLLTTATHTSTISDVVAQDTGGIGTVLHSYSAGTNFDQLPVGYNAGFAGTPQLGLRCQPTRSSLLTYSDNYELGLWTRTNCGLAWAEINLDYAPDGLRIAHSLVPSANNGYQQQLFACAASTVYTFSLFVRQSSFLQPNPVPGRLIAYDNTNAAEIASVAFTADLEWQRLTLRFTTPVGCVSCGFRIEVDNSGDRLAIYRAVAVLGEATTPIFSYNALATVAQTDFRIAGIDGQYILGARGEAEAHVICDAAATAAVRSIMDARDGVGNNDRRHMSVLATEVLRVTPYTSAGAAVVNVDSAVASWEVQHRCVCQWNYAGRVVNGLDGTRVTATPASWAALDQAETINLGQDGAAVAANQMDGLLAQLRIWDGWR